jgi:hypothetical protein
MDKVGSLLVFVEFEGESYPALGSQSTIGNNPFSLLSTFWSLRLPGRGLQDRKKSGAVPEVVASYFRWASRSIRCGAHGDRPQLTGFV